MNALAVAAVSASLFVAKIIPPDFHDVNCCDRLATNDLLYGKQRSLFVSEVHLHLHAVAIFDNGPHYRVLNLPVMKVHADFVADLKLALWVIGWHGEIVHHGILEEHRPSRFEVATCDV